LREYYRYLQTVHIGLLSVSSIERRSQNGRNHSQIHQYNDLEKWKKVDVIYRNASTALYHCLIRVVDVDVAVDVAVDADIDVNELSSIRTVFYIPTGLVI